MRTYYVTFYYEEQRATDGEFIVPAVSKATVEAKVRRMIAKQDAIIPARWDRWDVA